MEIFKSHKNPALTMLFFAIAAMAGCIILGTLISMAIAIPIFGKDALDLSNANSININVLRFLQTVQSISLFMVPPFIVARASGYKASEFLYIKKKFDIRLIVLSAVMIIALLPFINFLGEANSRLQLPHFMHNTESWMKAMESSASQLMEKMLSAMSINGLMLNIFLMALIPAISEELLFRGLLQRIFIGLAKNYHWGIIISAAVFSAFHLQFYGFVPRMLLGIIFGYLLVWTGNIWYTIFAHFLNNCMAVVYYYFSQKGKVAINLDTVGSTHDTLLIAIFSAIISGGIIYLIFRMAKLKKELA